MQPSSPGVNAVPFGTLWILTIPMAVALSVVSFAGAFLPGTYLLDSASMAAQGAGQDLVDLFLVVPLLLFTLFRASRGRRIALLFYAGILFYILYSFIIYSFGVHFNRLFLLYCSILGLSLYAFILCMTALRREDVAGWFQKAPVKLVSVYLLVVALLFYALWLKSVIPANLANAVPAEVADNDLLVSPVHVIDLAFALPGLIIGSVLLRRGRSLGYTIASVALVFMVVLTISLAAMVLMLLARGISEDFTVAMVFGALSLISLVVSILFFRKVAS